MHDDFQYGKRALIVGGLCVQWRENSNCSPRFEFVVQFELQIPTPL